MLKILVPEKKGIFQIAAQEFAALWKQITGEKLSVLTKDDGKSDLVVLGSDAVNAFTHQKIIEKVIPQFLLRGGSDEYHILSAKEKNRSLLFLAGARPRALLYAIYRFFELRAGCRWFWDGDMIPEAKTIPLAGLDLKESPRFQYRGLRYFAHRSLPRYQAEHWDFEDWKREIDWVLKKRMNLFMLRIGLDDLFQRAFPDLVSYPKNWQVPEAVPRAYDDRTLFWDLQYRGELRKKVLAYARERDLWHPEDLGTMTHWYSRTPLEYLDKAKPDFIPQCTSGYGEKTGLVWDIRQDKNLDAYFHLTETHIREYGSPELFHTIGLAERRCYADPQANHQMKLYAYRRIISKLRSKYPNAPLFIASWDFSMYWTPEEVRELLKELDPDNTVILDYTSDTEDELRTFQDWDVCGKFPWVFGIFHAYEPETELRGNYEAIARRLPIAAADPQCKGMIYWPENSHSDTLMLEFLAANAWDPAPENVQIGKFLKKFCQYRYSGKDLKEMQPLWEESLPLITARHWRSPSRTPAMTAENYLKKLPGEYIFRALDYTLYLRDVMVDGGIAWEQALRPCVAEAPSLLRKIADMEWGETGSFRFRDLSDLVKMILSRSTHFVWAGMIALLRPWEKGDDSVIPAVEARIKDLRKMFELYSAVLGANPENSLWNALLDLQAKHTTNPNFEYTLKGNAENGYCRTCIPELFDGILLPEFDFGSKILLKTLKGKTTVRNLFHDPEKWGPERQKLRDAFYGTPLKKLAPDTAKCRKELAGNLKKLADILERYTK